MGISIASSDVWTFSGLCLGTIGAVLLAYEVVYGPGKRFQATVFKTQLETLRQSRKYWRDSLKGFLPEERQKYLDEEEQQFGPQERELAKKVEEDYSRFEDRVVTLGAWGVILIVLAFLLQIVGLGVHAYEQAHLTTAPVLSSARFVAPAFVRYAE